MKALQLIKFEYKIPIIYFIIGSLWILSSDSFINKIVPDRNILIDLNIIKGVFYVSITTILLFYLLKIHHKKTSIVEDRINKESNELLKAQNSDLNLLEQVTEESELQFRLLVENAPEAIFIQMDWKFAYVNKAAIKLYGAINEEQLLGSKIIDRIHPDFEPGNK